jgi:hypothetical protein
MHRFLAVYYFYSAAPTCFDTYVSSSGSCSVPAELHANRMKWLIRFCVIRCYVEGWCAPVCPVTLPNTQVTLFQNQAESVS